jgi:hypothetical protein
LKARFAGLAPRTVRAFARAFELRDLRPGQAKRLRVGLPIWSGSPIDAARFGTTSVRQIMVSAASIWQKNGVGPLN